MAFLKMKWNLNYEIGFVMTQRRLDAWNEYYKALLDGRFLEATPPPKPDESGLTWMKMHSFMEVYGGSFALGTNSPLSCSVVLRVRAKDCFDALQGGLKK